MARVSLDVIRDRFFELFAVMTLQQQDGIIAGLAAIAKISKVEQRINARRKEDSSMYELPDDQADAEVAEVGDDRLL